MKVIIALAGLVCCVYGAPTTQSSQIQWIDCADDPANTILTLHSFNMRPQPISFPGTLLLSLNATVNKPITQLFIDVELNKVTVGGDVPVPCIQNIGTCQRLPACNLLDRVKNGSSLVSQNLGLQVDQILLAALGHNAKCPVQPESVSLIDEQLTLEAVPAALSLIATGDYKIKMSIFDDLTATANVGCVQFTTAISTPGFLFG